MERSDIDSDFNPSKVNAAANVMQHIATKGVQAGSLLGIFLVAPAAAFRHRARGGSLGPSFVPLAQKALTSTAAWTTILCSLTGFGVLGLKEGWDKEKCEDRAYRLYYNQGQNRVDEFSLYGAGGAGVLALVLGARTVRGIASGLLLGVAAGTILHVASSSSSSDSQLKSVESSVGKVAEELKR